MDLWDKSGPPPIYVNQILFNMVTLIYLCALSDYSALQQQSSVVTRGHIICRA